MRNAYPVIFTKTDTVALVEVPDLNIFTEGTNMADAIFMARDAIGLNGISIEDTGENIPAPSRIEDMDIAKGTFAAEGKSYLSMVDIDFSEYRRRNDNKTV